MAAFLSWVAFYALRRYVLGDLNEGHFFSLVGSATAIATFWVLLYALWGAYHDVLRKSRVKELFNVLSATFFGVVVIFFALLLDDTDAARSSYYRTIGTYFLLHFTVTAVCKALIMGRTKQMLRDRIIFFNTLIIGSGDSALAIHQDVDNNHETLGFCFLGYVHVFDRHVQSPLRRYLPHLGRYTDLARLIREHQVEQVVIAIEAKEHRKIEEILNLVADTNARVSVIPDLYQIMVGAGRVHHVFGTPLVEIKRYLMPVWQRVVKRLIDIVVSLLVLLLGSFFYAIVAIITKMTSEGPIIFSQERVGKDGEPFTIYKFRSMYTNAEAMGPALSSDHDPRITPWGRIMRKTRIDETPQFFNVLIGDMSFVGPRPERQFYIDQITAVAPHYKHLHKVRPGITSLGQVKYGYAENVDEMVRRLKYDIIYIENMSLAMDARILLYTILIIVQGRGK